MQRSRHLPGVLGFGLFWLSAMCPANAEVLAGVMKCRVAGNLSFVLGSQRDIACLYRPNGHGPKQYLVGTTDRFGIALGFQFAGTLLWDVKSALHDAGDLTGVYSGVGGDAKFFDGPNGDILVGGPGDRISLKPVTVGGPGGFEVSAGIGRVSLVRVGRSDLFEGLDDDDIE